MSMSLNNIDLNLLIYFDALLLEKNVTRAAAHLGISQPAMSNSLRRLRQLFDDPILVRTSEGMQATNKALELQPKVRRVLSNIELFVQSSVDFDPLKSDRVFRIMASDYAEAALVPHILAAFEKEAPNVTLDIMSPSDIDYNDLEQGKVDLAINRFDKTPASFQQALLWYDSFSCVVSVDNPIVENMTMRNYLQSNHVWVSKTGLGVSAKVSPEDLQKLGWVDMALQQMGQKRNIAVYTRNFLSAIQLTRKHNLVATIPSRAAELTKYFDDLIVLPTPFEVPSIELHMLWSPVLHDNEGHIWFRNLIQRIVQQLTE